MRLQFKGRIDCIHHINQGVDGDFKIPMDPRKAYSVIYLKVGRDEVVLVRPVNNKRLREWQSRRWDEEIRFGDKVRLTIQKLAAPKTRRKRPPRR